MFSKALGKREIAIVGGVIGTTLLILTCADCGEETIGKKQTMSSLNSISKLNLEWLKDSLGNWRDAFPSGSSQRSRIMTTSSDATTDTHTRENHAAPAPAADQLTRMLLPQQPPPPQDIHITKEKRNVESTDKYKYPYSLSKQEELRLLYESRDFNFFDTDLCQRHYPSAKAQVEAYLPTVQDIVRSVVSGSFKHRTYNELAYFLDIFGPRLSGSDALEDSIDFLKAQLQANDTGLDTVWTDEVIVPQWIRGEERAEIIKPRRKSLALSGLGESVSTPAQGISTDVVVFDSYREVLNKTIQLSGKVVVCNYGGPEGDSLNTDDNGYVEISDAGAVAVLYKSAATFSLYSVHARRANLYYTGASKFIPIAYLTVEDTEYLSRIYKRGESIEIYLQMQNTNGNSSSRNLFGELKGRETPEELLIVSAHTDSWDVGQGAQDDGVGIYLMLESMKIFESLGLRAKRTIRGALWTAEEYGYNGSLAYIRTHGQEMEKLRVVLEADYACLAPVGLGFNKDYAKRQKSESSTGPHSKNTYSDKVLRNTELGCILHHILQLLGETISQGALVQTDIFRTDLDHFQDEGIPVVSLLGDDGRYFWYHHTEADVVSALDSTQIDKCLAMWATTTYILADIDQIQESTDNQSSPPIQPSLTLHLISTTIPLLIIGTHKHFMQ